MGGFDDSATGFDSGTMGFDSATSAVSTQFDPDDLRVELWLKSTEAWGNHTSSVRVEDGVRITRGRQSEDGEAGPSSCSLTFHNTSGNYSPRNTAGSLYGEIGRNTPLRVGFGSPLVGRTKTGTGTPLTYEQIAASNGYGAVAVLAVGVTVPADNLTTPAGYTLGAETDAAAFTVGRYRFTDSDLVPSITSAAAGSPTGWATAHVAIPGGTYVVSGVQTADAGASPSGIGTSGLAEGDVCVAVVTWSQDPYGRMGPPYQTQSTVPAEMYMVCDSGPSTGPRIAVWAWEHRTGMIGVAAFGANDGVTGASLTVVEYSGQAKYSPRFCGEVANWPVVWDMAEADKTVSIEASGVTRRLAQQDAPSQMRAAFATQGDLLHYWPMEDEPGATDFAQAVGPTRMAAINGIAPGEFDAIAGSYSTPSLNGHGTRGFVTPANPAPWGFGGVFHLELPRVGGNLLFGECAAGGTISTFGVEYTDTGTLTAKTLFTDGTTSSTSLGSLVAAFSGGLLRKQMFFYIAMVQNGANVDWGVSLLNVTPSDALWTVSQSGTHLAQTVGPLKGVIVGLESSGAPPPGTHLITAGHVFVTAAEIFTGATYREYAARAYAGAYNTPAMWAQSLDAQVPFTFTLPLTDLTQLGPMGQDTAIGRMRTLAVNGQGLLQDAAGFPGIEYRPLQTIISSNPEFTFDYANSTFVALAPVDDDAVTVNDVTVTAPDGHRARVVVETGALGAQASGAGRYAQTVDAPVATNDQAADLAGWLASQGTVDLARWPLVTIRMNGAGAADWAVARFSIGDTIGLSNLPSFSGPDSVFLVVVGIQEEVDAAQWTVTLVTRPAELYHVLIWDDTTFGIWADSAAPSTDDAKWGMV